MIEILAGMMLIMVGIFMGWVVAHNVIATEIEKTGTFYVGDKVFSCTKLGTPCYPPDETCIGMKEKDDD